MAAIQVQPVSSVLLSTAYFGSVFYFRTILNARFAYIEKHEHFIKQTYRNRCYILGANGKLPLVVPVEQGRKPGQKITDIRIAYYTDWQKNHWRSIISAYKNSPFFDYYADDLQHFFKSKSKYLFDLNHEITNAILKMINHPVELSFTTAYESIDEPYINYRTVISPKLPVRTADIHYCPASYTQVFEDKFPFVPELSILDLLFCTGPGSVEILKL
jgi:hypothetical protein